jgi:predicted PhzF superfamily epimerase YddE/YHI9
MAETSRLDILRVFCAEDGTGGNPLGVFLNGHEVPEDRRQGIARDLGFSETVFVDDLGSAGMRIFTPAVELPLAGHPLVGTAWLLRERGHEPAALHPPAGEVPIRFDGELTCASARPEWGPPWEFVEAGSPAEIDALEGPPAGYRLPAVWAWIDEPAGLIRARTWAVEEGVDEDEATGSAALWLTALLGREIEIRQGRGSVLYAEPLDGGLAEVRGRVVADESRDYPV